MFFDGSSSSRKEANSPSPPILAPMHLTSSRSTSAASAKASPPTPKTKLHSSNKCPNPTPSPPPPNYNPLTDHCPRSRPCAPSARPCAAAKSARRSWQQHGAPAPVAVRPSHLTLQLNLSSITPLTGTLLSSLESRRHAHMESFIAMPTPATLSAAITSLNATHASCSPLLSLPRRSRFVQSLSSLSSTLTHMPPTLLHSFYLSPDGPPVLLTLLSFIKRHARQSHVEVSRDGAALAESSSFPAFSASPAASLYGAYTPAGRFLLDRRRALAVKHGGSPAPPPASLPPPTHTNSLCSLACHPTGMPLNHHRSAQQNTRHRRRCCAHHHQHHERGGRVCRLGGVDYGDRRCKLLKRDCGGGGESCGGVGAAGGCCAAAAAAAAASTLTFVIHTRFYPRSHASRIPHIAITITITIIITRHSSSECLASHSLIRQHEPHCSLVPSSLPAAA